jgi:hypothetical protein
MAFDEGASGHEHDAEVLGLLRAANDNDPHIEGPSEGMQLYVSQLRENEIQVLLSRRADFEAERPNLYKAIDLRLLRERTS